jgi:hypothetical protein
MPKADDIIQAINELSYRASDIPKLFRVVLTLEDSVDELKKRKLDGVTGISDSREIVMGFLGVARDTVLTMPAKETEKLNKLSRIMYDNPHYLLQDNMAALARVWDKSPSSMDGVIYNIFEYVVGYWSGVAKFKELVYPAKYFAWWQDLANVYYKRPKKINNVDDLTKWAMEQTQKMADGDRGHNAKVIAELSYDEMKQSILGGLAKVKQIYGSEGEWIVKDKSLKVPKGSTLLVLKAPMSTFDYPMIHFMGDVRKGKLKQFDKDMPDKEIYKAYGKYSMDNSPQVKFVKENGLDKLYKVIYVTSKEFHRVRDKYFKRKYANV